MSQSALQSAISNAPNCSLILFAAGKYNITSALNLKCSLTYAGPVATPATAEITTSTPNIKLTTMYGGCTTGTTAIEYLQFNGAAPLYLDPSNYSNIVFEHNQITSLPAEESCGQACEALLFDGNNNNSYSNITIEYNTFGDSNSCTAGVNVDDGSCAGILVGASAVTNFVVKYNIIQHVQEGIHFYNVNYVVGNKTAQCDGCDIEFNYFNQIHRIALEFQTNVINHQAIISNNVFGNPLNPYYNTLTLSAPCCQYSNTFGSPSNVVPSNQLTNNVEINTLGSSNSSPYGFEMAGNGTNANNNIIQGSFCNGFVWSFGAASWTIQNNTIQGSQMASGGTCPTSPIPSSPISAESGGTYSPVLSGNVMGATPAAITSMAPTISPASGSRSFPLTITLADPGYTSGSQPLGNTGIWYTTDGSTPVPGTGTAQYLASGGTFVLNAAATVKAVGMWGAWNQPTSYPAGYGFMPSGVVTTAYSVSGAIKQPASGASSSNSPSGKLAVAVAAAAELPAGSASAALESVAINPSQPVVAIGSTTQLKAIATFDDGSVKDVTADFGWQSSDPRTITANASGSLGGLASGPAVISGSYQGHQASVAASSAIGEVVWSDPIVITEGGTYSGNWQSTDGKTAAVTVATTAPVIIENAHIRSVGDLIKATVAGSNLTVRNSLGVAVNAAVKGQPNGVFLEVASPTRLDVENNYIENAQGGVIVHGYAGNRDGQQAIVIRSNRARNMNGLLSDGNGGYLPGEGANRSQARFIQFDSVQAVPGIDVGWNEVINYPGQSLVDDNIDLYRSGGTPNQPLEIHDTYIQGAYPYKAAQDAYTGGGIKTDAKAGDNAQEVPAFNSIHDNQVVGTVNYGIQFAAGHDNVAANNRVISSGLLADGTKIAAQQVGMANGDASGAGVANGSMYNNSMRANLIGWTCWQSSCAQQGYRKDQFFPAAPADYSTNSVVAARQITLDMENNEYQVWLNKMASAGIGVGPSF
jgi:Bacterial Ig-like domain (group 2)